MNGSIAKATTGLLLLFLLLPIRAFAGREADTGHPSPQHDHSLDHIIFRPDEDQFKLFPLTNYFNTAFDTAQVSRTFSQRGYFDNHELVLERVFDPHDNIKKDGGYDRFFRQEFASSRTLPNITLHLLGNGFDFRTLAEWYDHHGFRYPFVWAFLSSYAGYIGNEAIEASNPEIDASDHIADLYFFNLLGNLLYMNDTFANSIYNGLQLRNWTGQPFLDLEQKEILNASNSYVMRPYMWAERVRPFIYFGLHYFGGLSARLPDGSEFSVGAGFAVKDPLYSRVQEFADNFKKITPSGGLFWDRDDRLLASIIFNSTNSYLVRANIYPETLLDKRLGFGFFLGLSKGGTPSFGLTVHKFLAFGFR